MHCPQCGSPVAQGAKFCTNCGAKLPEYPPAANTPQSETNAQQPEQQTPAQTAPQPEQQPAAQAPAETAQPAQPTAQPAQPEQPAAPQAEAPQSAQPQAPQVSLPPTPNAAAQQQPTQQFTQPIPNAQFAQPTAQAPQQPVPPMQPAQQHAPSVKITPAHLSAFGVSLGIGMAAALVFALLSTVLAMTSFNTLLKQSVSEWSSMSSSDMASIYQPNFFQILVLMLVLGVSGRVSFTVSQGIHPAMNLMSFSLPLSLTGLALLVGAGFGAYMMARKSRTRFRWDGVISSLCVGVASGLVTLLLAALFQMTMGMDSTVFTMTGVTFRTFGMTFLLATVGALGGYFLADAAPDSSNVFVASWRWAHRARGFVRTAVESAAIFSLVFTVLGIITIIVLAVESEQPSTVLPLFTLLLPAIPLYVLVLASFGGIQATVPSSSLTQTWSLFNISTNVPQFNLTWVLWVFFVIAVLCMLYVAVREGARNYYDPHYAAWSYSWQAPVFWFAFWLICPYLIMSIIASTEDGQILIMPALWFSLVGAIWAFLTEVLARVLAPVIIQSMPGMWKCFVGGTVRPNPFANVAQATAQNAQNTVPAAAQTTASAAAQQAPHVQQNVTAPVATPVAAAPAVAQRVQPVAQPQQAPTAPMYQTAVPPTAAPAGAAPATTALTAKQKRAWLIAGIVAAVLVVLGIAYAVVNSTVFSANAVAKHYISAIENGDFDRANSIANPQLNADQSKLLSNAAAPDANGRITNAQIVQSQGNGNAKTLKVSYTLGGKQSSYDLKMIRKGAKGLIFSDWAIAEPMTTTVSVQYPEAVSSITINGVEVTEKNAKQSSDSSMTTFVVYPGTYKASAKQSKYYTVTNGTVIAGGASDASSDFSLEPTDDLLQEISDKVDAKLDECAKSKSSEPAGCPFSAQYVSSSDSRNFSWSVSEYPNVYVTSGSMQDGDFSVSGGTMKYTYEYKSYDNSWKPEDSTTSIYSAGGTFHIDGDKVTVTFNSDND